MEHDKPQRAEHTIAPCGLLPEEICGQYAITPKFRGEQIFRWLCGGVKSFSQMTDLPADMRSRLARLSAADVHSSSVESNLLDEDGTGKLKIRLADGAAIESVLLRDPEGRLTACLSTQVGCPMGCSFCKTATLGWQRNLATHEIVEQFIHLASLQGKPSNIVFMGMGEPLLNLDNLRRAIAIFTHPTGFGISKRKITISTCGIVPGIRSLADDGPHVRLAVSLTVADDPLRDTLMPVNRSYPLRDLKDALLYYQARTGDRITLEAAIMHNINTDAKAAQQMVAWIKPLQAQVNIIPWNPVEGLAYTEPTRSEVHLFIHELESAGINVVKRSRKGVKLAAACGQLGERLADLPKDQTDTRQTDAN